MKISLVLSGGGARGYIHIGVIEELKKYGFEIVSISGTSMGAVIGGIEACGKLDEYKKWITSLDFLDLFKFYKPTFKLDSNKIFKKLSDIIGNYKIEELPIKYTAVATDLTTKKEVWFQRGNLLTAMKASSAIPGVFEPVKINNRILVDGGVLNLMPVAPVMSDMSDLIIAVNLYSDRNVLDIKLPKDIKKKQTIFEEVWNRIFSEKEDIVDKSINLMMETIFRYRCAEYTPDIEIKVPQKIAKWYDFHRSLELIEYGKFFAREAIENARKEGIISENK
ncbi:patatin-like phospholipase family protein [Caminibacter mediatlanticus]|uniref:Patatin n=1 Tax=Caminibacter mediatlanticus TB-2 TaxID=391592 RepID=A0AAI9F270_9BACT|nr:patatin-like phospholipase family protein [Caminibacter mediatlanticus]EDM23494.1 Patatin [Caminibacter mediatlanticus TB-2]